MIQMFLYGWAHIAHDRVPDEIAERVRDYVLRGMGFIALHSAHPSKPMQKILGTSGSLQWREGDFCRVWNVCPTHPIAQGIPASFDLGEEEMYGEYFDIPKPDDNVFISWFRRRRGFPFRLYMDKMVWKSILFPAGS